MNETIGIEMDKGEELGSLLVVGWGAKHTE